MSVASYINYHRAPFTKFMSISEYNEKHQAHIPQNAEFETGFRAALADARRVTDPHDYVQHHFNVEEMKLRTFGRGRLGNRRSGGKSTVTNPSVRGASTLGNPGTVPARGRPDSKRYQLPATAKKPAPASTPNTFNGNPSPLPPASPAGGGGGGTPNPPARPTQAGQTAAEKKREEDNRRYRIRTYLYNGNRSGNSTPSEEEVNEAFTTEEQVLAYLALALKDEGIRSSIQYNDVEYHTDGFKRHLASVKQIMANLSLDDDILETKNNQDDPLYQELKINQISIVPLGDTLEGIDSVTDVRLREFLSQLPYSSEENPPNKELYVKRGGKKSDRVAEVKRILRVIKRNPEEYAEFLDIEETNDIKNTKFKVARSDKFPHNGPLGVEDISLDDVLDEYGEEAEHYEEATTGVSSLHEEIDAYLKSNAKDDASFARDRAHVVHFNTVSTDLPARLMKGRDRYMKRLKAYLDGDTSAKVRMMDNTEVLVSALSPNPDSLRALLKASSGEPRFCECA